MHDIDTERMHRKYAAYESAVNALARVTSRAEFDQQQIECTHLHRLLIDELDHVAAQISLAQWVDDIIAKASTS